MANPRPRLDIIHKNDENVEIRVDGRFVISANHDEHGWAGMNLVKQTAKRMYDVLTRPE
jgi:hypothetical protein